MLDSMALLELMQEFEVVMFFELWVLRKFDPIEPYDSIPCDTSPNDRYQRIQRIQIPEDWPLLKIKKLFKRTNDISLY